jgi:hypothetical protein
MIHEFHVNVRLLPALAGAIKAGALAWALHAMSGDFVLATGPSPSAVCLYAYTIRFAPRASS